MYKADSKLTQEVDAYIRLLFRPEAEKFAITKKRFVTGLQGEGVKWALDFILKKVEFTFSEKLLQLIEAKGRKPAEIYTKADVTKAHFAKIKANKNYHPSKETALALAVALHLNLEETADLIKRAGYILTHSSESDIIVEFFIERGMYDIDAINAQLYLRGYNTLTNRRNAKSE